MKRQFWISAGLFLLIVAGISPLRAAPVHDFHAALAAAARDYRSASFYLRTGNPGVAAFELQALSEKWQSLNTAFGQKPPAFYSQDSAWSETLTDIGNRITAGLKAAEAGDIATARDQLKPIRAALVDLRRRNGLFLFPDYVEEANRAMDILFKFRREPPDLTKPDEVRDLLEKATITSYWYKRCLEAAPEAYQKSAEFRRLLEVSIESLAKIWDAARKKDQRRVINILREIRSSDRLLYLKFG